MTGPVVIAIDGPAGAGKSTVGRAVARRLGLEYLDTGAMYRAVTFAAMRRGIPVHDTDAVAELAREVELDVDDDGVRVDGVDATVAIRGRDVTQAVSVVAANSGVRSELVERQRAWVRARGGGVVEGRDIASVVFPDARLKLYVTASPRVRARTPGRRDRRRSRRGRIGHRRARPPRLDARRQPAPRGRRRDRRRHERHEHR